MSYMSGRSLDTERYCDCGVDARAVRDELEKELQNRVT